MTLVDDFAGYVGMPVWFAGGALGLGVLWILLALITRYSQMRSFAALVVIVAASFLNVLIFYWPWYLAIMSALFLLQQTRTIEGILGMTASGVT